MKALVKDAAKAGSILTVVVMISAWLAISNHCVLGTMATQEKPPDNPCPFHSKQSAPAKQQQSSDSPCCKILRAVAPIVFQSFTAKYFALGRIDFPAVRLVRPPRITIPTSTLDTGPPGANSFAELILQRSILAHAPPLG
jgi:hypothetical protein